MKEKQEIKVIAEALESVQNPSDGENQEGQRATPAPGLSQCLSEAVDATPEPTPANMLRFCCDCGRPICTGGTQGYFDLPVLGEGKYGDAVYVGQGGEYEPERDSWSWANWNLHCSHIETIKGSLYAWLKTTSLWKRRRER